MAQRMAQQDWRHPAGQETAGSAHDAASKRSSPQWKGKAAMLQAQLVGSRGQMREGDYYGAKARWRARRSTTQRADGQMEGQILGDNSGRQAPISNQMWRAERQHQSEKVARHANTVRLWALGR